MKRLFITIAIVCINCNFCHSYSYWGKIYGGDNGRDYPTSIQEVVDGGYIVAGGSESFNDDLVSELWVVRLDMNGTVIWEKTYNNGLVNGAHCVKQTSDEGFIIAGRTLEMANTFGKIWIIKINSNGNIVWQKTYGDGDAYSMQEISNGRYIVAGNIRVGSSPEGPLSDTFVMELDNNGNVVWLKTYKEKDSQVAKSIQQTSDGGYIVAGYTMYLNDYPEIWILRLDTIGNTMWQKIYGDGHWHESYGIRETFDGGYISVGGVLLRLDNNGNIVWQRQCPSCESIDTTLDNAYIIGTYNKVPSGEESSWVLKVDDLGNVIWGKTYNGRSGYYERVQSIIQTADGGYVGAGFIKELNTSKFDMFVLKIDHSGEIPGCDKIEELNAIGPTTSLIAHDTNAISQSQPVAVINTNTTPKNSSARLSAFCCYSNEEMDTDGDNIDDVCDNCPNDYNPFQIDCDNDGTGDICDTDTVDPDGDGVDVACDNCPYIFNPNQEETDRDGLGNACDPCPNDYDNDIDLDSICGDIDNCNNIPNPLQEDTYPPQGNSIGDACECEGDFLCDGDADGSDASAFKFHFGRNLAQYPCTSLDPCRGDFNCDGDVDGTDASLFKQDFGRSEFNNPCPACETGAWCDYSVPPSTTTTMSATTTTSSVQPDCLVNIIPSNATVYTWATVQFGTTLSGDCNPPCYSWDVVSDIGSTIDNNGFYTAGGSEGIDTVEVRDNCNADTVDSAVVEVVLFTTTVPPTTTIPPTTTVPPTTTIPPTTTTVP